MDLYISLGNLGVGEGFRMLQDMELGVNVLVVLLAARLSVNRFFI
jgi:hypothetical protein